MQRRQKVGKEIQIRFLHVKIAAHRRAKNLEPANAELPAGLRNRATFLLDEVNQVLNVSQNNNPAQLAAVAAKLYVVSAESQSFQTGS